MLVRPTRYRTLALALDGLKSNAVCPHLQITAQGFDQLAVLVVARKDDTKESVKHPFNDPAVVLDLSVSNQYRSSLVD